MPRPVPRGQRPSRKMARTNLAGLYKDAYFPEFSSTNAKRGVHIMRRRLSVLVSGLVAFLLSLASVSAEDKIINVPNSDQTMVAAIAHAQETLDTFLALVDNPPAGIESFSLKVAITDGSQTEHFWITPFHREGEAFSGTISNTPELVGNVTEGREYRFPRADISDWGYMQDGKLHGYFTLRALLPYMAQAEAAQYRALLADD